MAQKTDKCEMCSVLAKLLEQSESHRQDLMHIIQQNTELVNNRNKELIEMLTGHNTPTITPPKEPLSKPTNWRTVSRGLEAQDRQQHVSNVQQEIEKRERAAGIDGA